MGIQDRDYMRERRPSGRTSANAAWYSPFRSQTTAFAMAVVGCVLISRFPADAILSLVPERSVNPNDVGDMMRSATRRGALFAAMSYTPAFRLVGLIMLASSGIALIKERRRWSFPTVVRNPTTTAVIGWIILAIAGASVMTQGVWTQPARRAAVNAAGIAMGAVPETLPIRSERVTTQVDGITPTERPQSGTSSSRSMTPGLQPTASLTGDRPFPANGTFERQLPLQGKIARMTFANRSQNNAVVVWLYNLNKGQGDQEALRAYVTAGQSTSIDIPAFDYRMAVYEASPSLGLDRGFGPNARPTDLGFVDLKTPADRLSQQPVGLYHGYGLYSLRAGVPHGTR